MGLVARFDHDANDGLIIDVVIDLSSDAILDVHLDNHSVPLIVMFILDVAADVDGNLSFYREGPNREKLTVKKIINKEIFFFHRLCPLQTVKNRRKP